MSAIAYRPATLEDSALASGLETAAYPDLPEDPVITYGRFIAERDGRPIAYLSWIHWPRGSMSYLFFPPVRGPVSTGYTCAHPDYRGRGLAHATHLLSLAQPVELGIPRVIADNDADNEPLLRINDKLGYRLRPGFVGHLKRVDSGSDA